MTGFRADRPDDPEVVVFRLTNRRGTRTGLGPDLCVRPLLSKPGLVLEVDP